MKVGKIIINLLKNMTLRKLAKARHNYPDINKYRSIRNIPYIDDGNDQHRYDVYFANENKDNIAIIDIHGGGYVFGNRYDNYPFGHIFLEQGFDFITLDYQYSNKDEEVRNLFLDVVKAFNHFVSHLKEYGLENRKFIVMGDSAGGHFALLLSELICSKDLQKELGIEVNDIDLIGTVVASPVYDVVLATHSLSRSGVIRMFGRDCLNEDKAKEVSPREHIKHLSVPLFHSTCRNDFLRSQSTTLYEDMKDSPLYTFVDIDSKDKEVDHVHNVTKRELKESIEVNNKTIEFIKSLK